MTLSAGAAYSAPILDALGKHDAAELLRWQGGQDVDDAVNEPDRLDAQERLDELEALLCKHCKGKWDKANGAATP